MACDRFANRVGYKGQKYTVYFTRDGVERKMGWQNQSSGGLEDAAKLMPGVTSTRVALAEEPLREPIAEAETTGSRVSEAEKENN